MQLTTSAPKEEGYLGWLKSLEGGVKRRTAILHFTDRWRYPKYPCPKCGLWYECQPISRFSKEGSFVRNDGALTYARVREDGVSFQGEVYLDCCRLWAKLVFPPRETWFWVEANQLPVECRSL